MIGQRHKLIYLPNQDRSMLFDLQNDPGEIVDLCPEKPEQCARLKAAAFDYAQIQPALQVTDHEQSLSGELAAELRAAGYLH